MKIFPLIAAAAVAFVTMPAVASAAPVSAPAAVAAPISAQAVRVSINDQRRDHGRRAKWRRVCTTKWRHGHRVRDCRRVRGGGRW
jgi:hypothetical protein